ncbi:MAG: DUF4249 family protein [Algoriphagus sp.]|uniref:DUF4249 family protein n=1 Tax=Algoriphagus sp. TaxID=1872435 RepID=UPI002634C1CC|nr:DUF4249 family protein [Algoriphagus sp.]MDG1276017.1 DUF4249 family protein [Algoriphagus sp.]
MKNIWIIGFLFFIVSCQIEVDLPLGEIEGDIPVIEAIWTDNSIFNEVKISLAKNYLDTAEFTPVTNAEVVIRKQGTETTFPFFYNRDTRSYKPVNGSLVANVGETYELLIDWNENSFYAQGLMLEAPSLDSLTYQFEEERPFRDEGYYIKAYGKIPFEENNYYRIQIIENDTLKNDPEDYFLFDDTFGFTFFENGLELGYAFEPDDRVRLILYRMTVEPYNYLNQLLGLLFTDGGLFSPPPQNPDSNIEVIRGDTEVFGYFLVSPILTEFVVIKE